MWKDYPNNVSYEISDEGEVRKRTTGLILKSGKTRNGYLAVTLREDNGGCRRAYVHRLVAETYLPNPENKSDVNHKDGNKLNNHLDNLEWATRSENLKHAYDMGLKENNREIARNLCLTNEKILQYREQQKVRVQQLDEFNNLIAEYTSIAEAARATGIFKESIAAASLGKRRTAGGFKWKRLNHDEQVLPPKIKERAVRQIDFDGNVVNDFPSIAEAGRKTGIDAKNIQAVCAGKRKTTGGYKWEYI